MFCPPYGGSDTWKALYAVYLGIAGNIPLPGPGAGSGEREYVVQAGDTLWLLSRRYGTTVDAIKRLNGLTGDALSVGQVLKIPQDTARFPGGMIQEVMENM